MLFIDIDSIEFSSCAVLDTCNCVKPNIVAPSPSLFLFSPSKELFAKSKQIINERNLGEGTLNEGDFVPRFAVLLRVIFTQLYTGKRYVFSY